jgi:hypothetical protein
MSNSDSPLLGESPMTEVLRHLAPLIEGRTGLGGGPARV